MRPILEAVASENYDTFTIALLNIDENLQTTAKYGVRGIPDYRVFRNGEVVAKFVGAMPKADFVRRVLDALE